jgi:cobalt-zinc-cadmium efflux system protein
VHSHAHSHGHGHGHATSNVLRWSTLLTAAFVAVEIIGGIRAHSLALLSDAGHNFTDAIALLLAWFGLYLETKPADESKTYGYHRGGVLAAFVNALALIALSAWIFAESVGRLRNPHPVASSIMIGVAALGLLINSGIMLALWGARRRDVNIRGAFLHMLGDALGSIAIIAGAVAIRFTGWQRVDPLLSILIAFFIVWTAWDIVRESLDILLEGLPTGMSLADVEGAIESVEGVLDVHDLHIWSLGSNTRALSCHVQIHDIPPSASDAVLQRVNGMLAARFHVYHTTVQFEHTSCSISETGCAIPVSLHQHDHEHHEHDH